jgi:hypothetical protein
MSGDGEIKKLRKDLAKNREEIADLQRRIHALILKRRSAAEKKSGKKQPPSRG